MAQKRQKVGTKMPMKCVLVDNEICQTDIIGKWDLGEFHFFVCKTSIGEVKCDVDVSVIIRKIYAYTGQ